MSNTFELTPEDMQRLRRFQTHYEASLDNAESERQLVERLKYDAQWAQDVDRRAYEALHSLPPSLDRYTAPGHRRTDPRDENVAIYRKLTPADKPIEAPRVDARAIRGFRNAMLIVAAGVCVVLLAVYHAEIAVLLGAR